MRILVDGGTWTNRRGYGRFTRELISAAATIPSAHELALVLDDSVPTDDVPSGIDIERVHLGALPTDAASAGGHRSLRDLWTMSRALSRSRADCVFFPSVYTYVPLFTHAPVIICVHDVIPERLPSQVFPTRRSRMFWTLKTRTALHQATRIVTVSEHARRGIASHFGIEPQAIGVISEAPSGIFSPAADPSPGHDLLRTLGLSAEERLLLYVGGLAPHKNLAALLHAMVSLRSKSGSLAATLLIVGDYTHDAFRSAYPTLRAQVERERLAWVRFTGALPDRTVAALMRLADALVLPSFEEGFGLPGVEAAACGAVVVATRHSALPDVLGDTALYFDPHAPDELERALEAVLTDPSLRATLGARASVKASALTWTTAARRLLDTFEELAGSNL